MEVPPRPARLGVPGESPPDAFFPESRRPMIFLWIVLFVFLIVVAVFLLLLFSPVVAEVDTALRRIKIQWSPFLTYVRPLPGTDGVPRMSLAGIPIRISTERRKRPDKRKKEKPTAEQAEARRSRQRRQARALWECLLDDDVRGALVRRFRRLPADLWKAVEVSHWYSDVSLPDPALNGMLWGALAAADGRLQAHVQCNFEGRNTVQTEVRIYLYRVAKAFAVFFLRLPYRAIYRHWRAS